MVARRDFIKLAAVATAASPFILSNSARAAQNSASTSRPTIHGKPANRCVVSISQ